MNEMFDRRSLLKELRSSLSRGRKGPELHRILPGVGEGVTSQNSANLGTLVRKAFWKKRELLLQIGLYCLDSLDLSKWAGRTTSGEVDIDGAREKFSGFQGLLH